jgi:hypothetical protein
LASSWSNPNDEYFEKHIRDALWLIAMALDKVTKECLGDPADASIVASTIEKGVWKSNLTLSKALGSTPLEIKFDERGHRMLPMALGNLVNGSWKVAGVYDPAAKKFTERTEIIWWPKTGKAAPRFWASCKQGERLTSPAGELQFCETCQNGTYSTGERSTACKECEPGGSADLASVVACVLARTGRPKWANIFAQASSSPAKGNSVASAAIASAMSTKSNQARRHVRPVRLTRKDISDC